MNASPRSEAAAPSFVLEPLVESKDYTVSWGDAVFVGGLYFMESSDSLSLAQSSTSTNETLIALPTPTSPCPNGQSPTCYSLLRRQSVTFLPELDSGSLYEFMLLWAPIKDPSSLNTRISPQIPAEAVTDTRDTPPVTASVSQNSATPPNSVASGPVSPSTPSQSPSFPIVSGSSSTGSSSGLGTSAIVGISIGAAGFALLVLIGALFLWRRSRKRQIHEMPTTTPYTHNHLDSTNRDLTTDKEMDILSSPVGAYEPANRHGPIGPYESVHRHAGFADVPTVAQAQVQPPIREQRGSWTAPDEHGGSYSDSYNGHGPPPAVPVPVQRKPVGGATSHLREPGMSDAELARLEEEERRIDEAIAEAERRRRRG